MVHQKHSVNVWGWKTNLQTCLHNAHSFRGQRSRNLQQQVKLTKIPVLTKSLGSWVRRKSNQDLTSWHPPPLGSFILTSANEQIPTEHLLWVRLHSLHWGKNKDLKIYMGYYPLKSPYKPTSYLASVHIQRSHPWAFLLLQPRAEIWKYEKVFDGRRWTFFCHSVGHGPSHLI